MTLSPGESVHARTVGASRWAGLWISTADLASYSQALTGKPIEGVAGIRSWRPDRAAMHTLTALHAAAVKLFESRPKEVSTASAIRGLEQQLIHALVECLSGSPTLIHGVGKQRANVMVRFEAACIAHAQTKLTLLELCATLEVAERSLQTCSRHHLGMGPMRYLRARRMKFVRDALRMAQPADSKVADLATRYGFSQHATLYRGLSKNVW